MKFHFFIFCFVIFQIGFAIDDAKIEKSILINNDKSTIFINQPIEPIIPKDVTVLTKYGTINGFKHIIGILPEYGEITSDIFLGIPYAKPPIGELRFEKPEPLTEPFIDGKLNATKFSPGCISFFPLSDETQFSEDCLYLNVFAPPKKAQTLPNGFPVLVWIHGGGFSAGTSKLYGYQEFATNFVSRGIVVVSIQYRLGMFGFMSTGDEIMPGNLGMWDQRQALLWIKENINQFGGDPNKITLWGQNSGSANVGALSLSKWTRDLFNQSIQMSGSIYSGWALSDSVVGSSRLISKSLNCPLYSKKMKMCLKTKSAQEISIAGSKLTWQRDDVNFMRMQMRLDDDFFDKSLDELLAEAPRKPTIQGINSQESMTLTMPFPGAPKTSKLIIKSEEIANFDREKLIDFIKTIIITEKNFGEKTKEVQNAVISFYTNPNINEEINSKFYITKYTQLLSDLQYNMPVLEEVIKKSSENWPVYLYLINYMNSNITLPVDGVFQTYEFPYLFGFSVIGQLNFDEKDREFQKVLIQSLANFVITGNPSSQYGIWSQISSEHPLGYFDISPKPIFRNNLMLNRIEFWHEISKNYQQFDIIRSLNKNTIKPKNDF